MIQNSRIILCLYSDTILFKSRKTFVFVGLKKSMSGFLLDKNIPINGHHFRLPKVDGPVKFTNEGFQIARSKDHRVVGPNSERLLSIGPATFINKPTLVTETSFVLLSSVVQFLIWGSKIFLSVLVLKKINRSRPINTLI